MVCNLPTSAYLYGLQDFWAAGPKGMSNIISNIIRHASTKLATPNGNV